MVKFTVTAYDPEWPQQFESIAKDLEHDLKLFNVPFIAI